MKNLAPKDINDATFNVLAYGAKGDNSNNDDVGVQAALDAAWKAGGGEVVAPKGIYRIMQSPLRIRQGVTLTLQPGAEFHRYHDASSMVWNGDGSQNRAGWTGHGNITIQGGTWDMRCSSATQGCTTQSSGGTTAPAQGTSESWVVADNNGVSNMGWPAVPFYVYDPAAPTETMKVTAVASDNVTWTVTRGLGPGGVTSTPVTHTAGFVIRNADYTLARDDFTRSNTTAPHTLGVMTSGQTWINETSHGTGDTSNGGANAGTNGGTLAIVSNTAANTVSATDIQTVNVWPDGRVQADISTVGTTGYAGVVFRCQNSQNYWQYVRDNANSGNARLSYFVNGVETVVTPTATQAVSAGNTMTVVFYGSTIKCYVGTTLTHDTTDAAGFTANRKAGILISDTTSRIDNFVASAAIWQDTFDRTNSTSSLGTMSNGQMSWTAATGTLGINSNLAYAPAAGDNKAVVPVTSETNIECLMTTAGNAGIIFRYKDANNFWYYVRHTDGNARLGYWNGGVETVITPSTTQAVSSGDLLRVTVLGGHIRTYVDNVKTHDTGTTTSYQTFNLFESKAGIAIYDTTARLNNFTASVAWGTMASGACFNFGHAEQLNFMNLTWRDVSGNSHATEIAGCRNVLFENCTLAGMCKVYGRTSEGIQLDLAKGNGYFAAFGPHDNTTSRDVAVSKCSFIQSYMPGTTVWDRGVGSHSGTVGVWHDRLRVVDNYFEVDQRAARAYNWNNVIIQGNNISSGWGIEVRPIWTSNTADTFNTAGTQTSASQALQGIVISDNTINAVPVSAAQGSSDFAIRVFGETTGHIAQVSIQGNVINQGSNGGIWLEYADRGAVDGNTIYNVADRGIWVKSSTDIQIADNAVYTTGSHGLTLTSCTGCTAANNIVDTPAGHGQLLDTCVDCTITGGTVRHAAQHGFYIIGGSYLQLTNNYCKGANSDGTASGPACFRMGTTPDSVWVTGNKARKWGSGTEASYAFYVGSGTNVNSYNNDWLGGGNTQDVRRDDAPNGPLIRQKAGATTAIGTSITAATGLSMTLPVGMWRIRAWVNVVLAGSPTGLTLTVSPSGAPTTATGGVSYEIKRWLGGSAQGLDIKTSFNSASAGTTPIADHFLVDGIVDVTVAGTYSISLTRTGGTSATVQADSFIEAERITGENF